MKRAVALVLAAGISVQFGAAFAVHLFDRLGPAGTVLLRLAFAAVVLVVLLRPVVRGRTRADLGLALALGLTLGFMNWTFYEALDRMPIGPTVTIEMAGPLGVAVWGSRRPLDFLWIALAAVGVVVLIDPFGSGGLDPVGVLLALTAGGCWATYILLTARTGRVWPGASGLAVGMGFGALVAAPAGIVQGGADLLQPELLAAGLAVALLSSVIPYSLEMEALRTLPERVFGVMMTLEPGFAALAGLLLLGQDLAALQVVAIALVITGSAGATLTHHRSQQARPRAGPSLTAMSAFAERHRGLLALSGREVARVTKLWTQTIAAPVLSSALFILVFGLSIGGRIKQVEGFDYKVFIVPGLITMAMAQAAYANNSATVFQARFDRYLNDVLSAPMRPWEVNLGLNVGGAVRALAIGAGLLAVAAPLTGVPVRHPFELALAVALMLVLFCTLGVVVGVYANSWDHTAFITNIVILPLTFLGGVFYAVDSLPSPWQEVSHVNPIFFLISAVRYGFLGTSDVPVGVALGVTALLALVFCAWSAWLFRTGRRLKP